MENTIKKTAKERLIEKHLDELAEEAMNAEETIEKIFSKALFKMGEEKIHIYHTGHGDYEGDGYLTHNGVFEYHDNWWGGRGFSVTLTMEGIYSFFRSCYLKEEGLSNLDPEKFFTDVDKPDEIFRRFLTEKSA